MGIRVYHLPPSRSTRVVWALEELGVEYDVTLLTREEKAQEEYKRTVHPLGRVPAIDDGQGPVFESLAICLHLADLHPEGGLNWPAGTHERALVYQWASFAMTELEPPIMEAWRYEDHPDVVEKATERFRSAATVLEQALAGKEFLVGDRFSIADLTLGAVVGFGRRRGLLGDDFPNCLAYDDRLVARPARVRANEVGG
ncbi:MAG: glutathione S-transferase family protein [Gaiella sp.]